MLSRDEMSTTVISFPLRGDRYLFREKYDELEPCLYEDNGFVSLMTAKATSAFSVLSDEEVLHILQEKCRQVNLNSIFADSANGDYL